MKKLQEREDYQLMLLRNHIISCVSDFNERSRRYVKSEWEKLGMQSLITHIPELTVTERRIKRWELKLNLTKPEKTNKQRQISN